MPSLRTVKFAPVSVALANDNQLVAADARNKIKVVSYVLVAGGAVTVTFRSGTTPLTGAMPLAANGGLVVPAGSDFQHLLETAVNQALNLFLGGAVQVSGHIGYILDPN